MPGEKGVHRARDVTGELFTVLVPVPRSTGTAPTSVVLDSQGRTGRTGGPASPGIGSGDTRPGRGGDARYPDRVTCQEVTDGAPSRSVTSEAVTPRSALRPRHLPRLLAAVGALLLVTSCAEESASGETGASTSSSPSSAPASEERASAEELTAALLPAEAFGPGAQVSTVSVQQLATNPGAISPESTIDPDTCTEGVGGTQPAFTPDDGTIVAQTGITDTSVTVEVLVDAEDIDGLTPDLADLAAQCPQVTVNAPDGSTATIDFAPLDVPETGDFSEAVTADLALTAPDGTNLTLISLLAVAVDGDRFLFLQQTAPTSTPPDPAAFAALFEDAFDAQHQS